MEVAKREFTAADEEEAAAREAIELLRDPRVAAEVLEALPPCLICGRGAISEHSCSDIACSDYCPQFVLDESEPKETERRIIEALSRNFQKT